MIINVTTISMVRHMIKKLDKIKIDETEMHNLCSNLQILLEKKNISITELARRLEISPPTLTRIFSGETSDPRLSTLKAIANFFKVSMDSLVSSHLTSNTEFKARLIPVITWEMLQVSERDYRKKLDNWGEWQQIPPQENMQISETSFALVSGRAQYPRYPVGTLLVIDPVEKPLDGDIIITKSLFSGDIACRELIIDAPNKYLSSITSPDTSILYNPDETKILGVIILSLFFNTRRK